MSGKMNINNPNDMKQFLVSHSLTGLCPEAQGLVSCMDILGRMCSCDPQAAKTARYNQCIGHYVKFVSRAQNFSGILLKNSTDNRMSFFLNGQQIGNVTR